MFYTCNENDKRLGKYNKHGLDMRYENCPQCLHTVATVYTGGIFLSGPKNRFSGFCRPNNFFPGSE